jgi:hypothetical protein
MLTAAYVTHTQALRLTEQMIVAVGSGTVAGESLDYRIIEFNRALMG